MATERFIELWICPCRRHGHWILPDGTITDERSCQSLLLRELQVVLEEHPMPWRGILKLEAELAKSGIASHAGQASPDVIDRVCRWNRLRPEHRMERITQDHVVDPRLFEASEDEATSEEMT